MASPTREILYDVCGPSPSDVYAAGKHGTLLHFDGAAWRSISPPAGNSWDLRIQCRDDLLVLLGSKSALLSAGQWSSLPAFPPGPLGSWLLSAWIETPQRILFGRERGGLLLLDHGQWSMAYDGNSNEFPWGLFGTTLGQVVATGDSGWIVHRDGGSWRKVETGDDAYYPNVWGSDAAGFYIVGVHGRVLHYDGTTLQEVFSVPLEYSTISVWGTGPRDVYVGGKGIWHFDGVAWTQVLAHDGRTFNSIWGFGPEDLFAVGGGGRIARYSCRPE